MFFVYHLTSHPFGGFKKNTSHGFFANGTIGVESLNGRSHRRGDGARVWDRRVDLSNRMGKGWIFS